ncbi:MAG: hypothetical protein NHB32_00870 [Fischerella sp. CENA71]|nr:hypothetical protein [Fischerella sp. CENA71]
MNDKKIAPQAAVPNQPAAKVQQAQYEQNHYSGGNAMLDAKFKQMKCNKPPITTEQDAPDPGIEPKQPMR